MALQFPYDNRDDYPGKIIFRAYAPPVPDVNVRAVTSVVREAVPEFFEGIEESLTSFGGAGANVEAGNRIIYGPNANTRAARRNISTARKVTLYLPQAIIFSDQAEYDANAQLGIRGGLAENVINRGGSAGAALASAVNDTVSVFSDLVTGNTGAQGEAARLAVTRIARTTLGETGGNVAASVLRVAVNPNKRTLFRAVNIREFAFQFKMIANSAREAQEIENIIKFFRTELYPSTVQDAEIVGYNFPNLFDIQMKYNSQPVATKIKPSYLRNVQVTYNPSSMGWHIDGKPSEVDMTLAFVEERTLDKSDVARGF